MFANHAKYRPGRGQSATLRGKNSALHSGGFTLIEMMVVIAIIAILMAAIVAVGSSVRTAVLRRHTLAELKVLQGVMQEYMADGNPEPKPPTTPGSPTPPWPYSVEKFASSTSSGQYARTIPESDVTNWVTALESNPKYAKKLAGFGTDTDAGGVPTTDGTPSGTPIAPRPVIVDAFGYPIRYVPYDPTTKKQAYFMSAGPDGKFSMECPWAGAPPYTSSTTLPRPDEIYSTDPQ